MSMVDDNVSLRKSWATEVRWPMVALALLGLGMSVAFPIWRLAASRQGYILHLSDDSFYYFSVAPHLAAGEGPTADGITWTTGWHPLYGFLLAGLYKLTQPSLDGFVKQAIGLNALFYILSAYVLYLAGRCWWGKAGGAAAALLWLSSAHGVITAAMGLETSTYALCLALVLWRVAAIVTIPRSKQKDHPQITQIAQMGSGQYVIACAGIGACAGLCVLSRTDSILLMPFVGLMLLIGGTSRPGWAARFAGAALFGVLVLAAYAAWIGYVYHYTHELNQGSAAVKMEWRKFMMRDRSQIAVIGFALTMLGGYLGGAIIKVSALKWVVTGVPLVLRAARTRTERGLVHLLWGGPIVLGLAYALVLDWARAWYVAPALLTLTLLSAGAAAAILSAPTAALDAGWPGGLQRLVKSTLGLIAWAVVLESAFVFGITVAKEFDPKSEKLIALRVARWLDKNAEPQARIGCWHSGIIGYYTTSANVINLDGLNNNDILPILRGDRLLNPYWDRIGLAGLIPSGDVDDKTGEVGKMGRFHWIWGHKRLVQWREAPGYQRPATMDIYEQVIPQRVYRVIEEPSAPASLPLTKRK